MHGLGVRHLDHLHGPGVGGVGPRRAHWRSSRRHGVATCAQRPARSAPPLRSAEVHAPLLLLPLTSHPLVLAAAAPARQGRSLACAAGGARVAPGAARLSERWRPVSTAQSPHRPVWKPQASVPVPRLFRSDQRFCSAHAVLATPCSHTCHGGERWKKKRKEENRDEGDGTVPKRKWTSAARHRRRTSPFSRLASRCQTWTMRCGRAGVLLGPGRYPQHPPNPPQRRADPCR